jgi:hypothetical protein
MAGYYYMDSPSLRGAAKSSEEILETSDAAAAVACLVAEHNAELEGLDEGATRRAKNPCADKFKITSASACFNDGEVSRSCRADANNPGSMQRFVISRSEWAGSEMSGSIMETLRKKYKNTSGLGIVMASVSDGDEDAGMTIMSAGRKPVAIDPELVRLAKLQAGDLAYISHHSGDELEARNIKKEAETISCAKGEVKVFRFRNWRCEQPTPVKVCQGDTVYDRDLDECVDNVANTIVCGGSETAVVIDGVWTCQPPKVAKECPTGKTASFDYDALEWVCVGNPAAGDFKKCAGASNAGANCSDCEAAVQDDESCEISCIPNAAKLTWKSCYPDVGECNGGDGTKAFYFGFPNDASYNARAMQLVAGLAAAGIPRTDMHSANRKFNCLDCAPFKVSTENIFAPYIASCVFEGTHSSVCGANSVFVPSPVVGENGRCESLELRPELVPPCPNGYARATLSAACSPKWCGGDNGSAGVYCSTSRQLMVLAPEGCAYCINPRPGQVPIASGVEIDINKNAGNNGYAGGVKVSWSGEYGYEIPVIPPELSGFNLLGGRRFADENIFDGGRVINLMDAIVWGDKTGMPVPMPVAVPQGKIECDMTGSHCSANQNP